MVAVKAIGEDGGGEAGGEGGFVAQQAKQLQAQALAGLFLEGADIERGGEVRGGEAVGVDDPEGEDEALVVSAGEVGTEEAHEGVGKIEHRGIGASGYRVI